MNFFQQKCPLWWTIFSKTEKSENSNYVRDRECLYKF